MKQVGLTTTAYDVIFNIILMRSAERLHRNDCLFVYSIGANHYFHLIQQPIRDVLAPSYMILVAHTICALQRISLNLPKAAHHFQLEATFEVVHRYGAYHYCNLHCI